MPIIFKAAFLLSLGSILVAYPLYFLELRLFGKLVRAEHPALAQDDAGLSTTYKALMRVKAGELDGVVLSAAARNSCSWAKRWLYLGASLFLVVLFIGLADSD